MAQLAKKTGTIPRQEMHVLDHMMFVAFWPSRRLTYSSEQLVVSLILFRVYYFLGIEHRRLLGLHGRMPAQSCFGYCYC